MPAPVTALMTAVREMALLPLTLVTPRWLPRILTLLDRCMILLSLEETKIMFTFREVRLSMIRRTLVPVLTLTLWAGLLRTSSLGRAVS